MLKHAESDSESESEPKNPIMQDYLLRPSKWRVLAGA
jgi:hypothetical protein